MTTPNWQATVLTLFPDMFPGPLGGSILGKALERGLWGLDTVNIRDFATDSHKTVDDTPYGGGAGMVMKADVVDRAITHVKDTQNPDKIIYLSPRGKKIDQKGINSLAELPKIALLCGRYEGIDDRVIQYHGIEEVSLGDFVLCGGELPAMCLIESCVRLVPGVMGDPASHEEESFQNGLLEHPHYTRPLVWEGMQVPEVLTSGNHKEIKCWRQHQAETITKDRRPDLWKLYEDEDKVSS